MSNKFMSIIISLLIVAGIGVVAFAQQQYDLKSMTPEVQQALDNRKNHFSSLNELKSQGIIGENNKGYVELLKDDAAAEELVSQENMDREVIYTTIASQNGIKNEMATIERVFAQVQRERAKPGEMIQSEDGQWGPK